MSQRSASASVVHLHRVRRMLAAGHGVLLTASLLWGVHFALLGWWPVVASDVLMCLVGALGFRWLHQGHTLRSGVLLVAACGLILTLQSLYLDVPSPAAPRSVHLYLLPLVAFTLVVFRDEPRWLRYGSAVLCLVLFVVFASWPYGWSERFVLPDPVRVYGTWINALMAISTLALLLHILQTDAVPTSVQEQELRRALEMQQMVLYYQPQVDADGQVRGAEALVRWKHPVAGIIAPADFIPLAERTGLILAIGDQVLRQSAQQLALWALQPSFAGLTLSVNVSAAQLNQDGFVQQVLDIVQANGIEPGRLRLELTESLLLKDMDTVIDKMVALKAHGVGFSLDDFGTGFSSLNYLKRLPLDELKIDKSFVDDVATNENDRAIVQSVLGLGRQLGLEVIAEGVETEVQWQALRECGCRSFQGYWFAQPAPLERFEAYVDAAELRQTAGVRLAVDQASAG
jgi:diguanylate cyclase